MSPAAYALLPRLDAVTRPIVFPDIQALAAHIERRRQGQALELVEVEDLHHRWHLEGGGVGVDLPLAADRGVQIWTLDMSNGRDRCIGWAWLNGGGLERLREALRGAQSRHSIAAARPDDGSPLGARRAYARLRDGGWSGPRETYVPMPAARRA